MSSWPVNRIEVCLRIVPFKNGREEVIADTRIDCQFGRGSPIILHENSEDLSVVVDIVDVVDPTTVRLPRWSSVARPLPPVPWAAGLSVNWVPKFKVPRGAAGWKIVNSSGRIISAKLDAMVMRDQSKRYSTENRCSESHSMGGMLDCPGVDTSIKVHLRQSAIICACLVRDAGKSNGRRDIGAGVELESWIRVKPVYSRRESH